MLYRCVVYTVIFLQNSMKLNFKRGMLRLHLYCIIGKFNQIKRVLLALKVAKNLSMLCIMQGTLVLIHPRLNLDTYSVMCLINT